MFSKLCIPQIATFVFGEGHLDVRFGAKVGHLVERLFGPAGLEAGISKLSSTWDWLRGCTIDRCTTTRNIYLKLNGKILAIIR